ncbi:MAG: anti-sigma factor family protein [Thermoguttaceae bacterium]
MNDFPDTELFSAYLDGELTADEQVRVEQILATSPEARQLLEEMRALGSTLQELPQEKLDEDLSARVLEVAERRMLLPDLQVDDAGDKPSAGRAAETLNPAEADSIGWLGVPWREISWHGMFSKRALIWSGVVVATAIIINFTSPPPPKPNQNVAKLGGHDDLAGLEKKPAARSLDAVGEEDSKSSISDGRWEAPAGGARKPPTVDRLAKDDSRKAVDFEDRAVRPEAVGVGRNRTDGRIEEEVIRARRRVDDNMFDNKVADIVTQKDVESLARPMSKAGLDELAKDSTSEQARAKKASGDEPRVAEKPRAAVVFSAPGGQPGSRAAAGKSANRDGSGFGARSAAEKSIGERAFGEARKGGPVSDDSGPAGSVRPEEKKSTAAIESLAESKPTPAPAAMPTAPTPATPSPPAALAADTAVASPPPAVAMTKALGIEGPVNAKRGLGEAVPKSVDRGDDRVAKGSDATQLMNGVSVATNGNSSSAEAAGAFRGKAGQTPPNRLAGKMAAAATFVRLDVSALAVQNKVFENLLAHPGLGSDQNSSNLAQNAPTVISSIRASQLDQGGQGGFQDLSRQPNMAANGSRGFQLAPSGSVSSRVLNQQQVASQSASPAGQSSEFRAQKREENIPVPTAPANSQRGMDVKAPRDQRDDTKDVRQQLSRHVIYYEFDASPEQLAIIIKQISEKSDSFSAPKIESAVSASPGATWFAQNDINSGNNPGGGLGGLGIGGGGLAYSPVQQQQAMAAGGGTNPSPKESAQYQAVQAPASGAVQPATAPTTGNAKQHVVFVLNVVDHLVPTARRASSLPAAAAPEPAK